MKNLFLIPVMAIGLASCAVVRADIANKAKLELVGKPKEKILACMGAPNNRMAEGQTEVWSYGSGGSTSVSTFQNSSANVNVIGNTAYGNGFSSGSGIAEHRYCNVNVVFNAGVVSAVNYTGNTGGLVSQGEQCAYAVQACQQQ